ncbi:hypothetical protein MRX96_016818 [Rhipicephalus microplus]|uniref:treslin-like n=1 Tax=Rhipicephalus microplus TaxID=6941 RepID=UPI0018884E9B|nr:uncharacterized protein LOC119161293 [Rhipicephalus microplus]
MFQSTKAVFLVDVASFFSREDRLSVADYQQAMNAVKYCCLKFLTHFGTKRTRWGYKFYNRNGSARQRMEKRLFCEFNLETFEDFEEDLVRRFEHYRQACDAIDRSGSRSTTEKDPPCSVLRAALTQIFSEYQWDAPSLSSPVKWKLRKREKKCTSETCEGEEDANYVFNISPCPHTDSDVAAFLGRSATACADVADEILPAHVRRLLFASALVKFFWIDTTSLEATLDRGTTVSPKLRKATTALGGDVMCISTLVAAGSVCLGPDGRVAKQGPLTAVPFCDVANSYFSKTIEPQAKQPLTPVVYKGTHIGLAVLCPNSSRVTEELVAAEDWKEIRILGRTKADARLCIFQSTRVQIFRCAGTSLHTYSRTPATALNEILACLVNDNGALFVEMLLNHSFFKHSGFLFPIDYNSFSVHIVTKPAVRAPMALSKNAGREFANGNRDEMRRIGILWRSSTSSRLEKPFAANVLEKWFVPASTSCIVDTSNEQAHSTSQDYLLKLLRREYRTKLAASKAKGEHRIVSDEPKRPVSVPKMRRCLSVSFPVMPASDDNMEATSFGRNALIATPSSDVDQLVIHLKECYDAALNAELPASLLTCAQNIVSVVKRFAESQPSELSCSETACRVLRTHFTLSCVQIAEKYVNHKDDDSVKRRVNEYQLQALLALEEEVNFQSASNCVERVTSLLRTLSFIYNPACASEFLKGIVSSAYLITLKDILMEIAEELNIQIISDELDTSLGSEGDIFRLGSVPSMQSQESYLSSIPSSLSLMRGTDSTNTAENKALVRVDLSQPPALEKLQIVVKQASTKDGANDSKSLRKHAKRARTGNAQSNDDEVGCKKSQKSITSTPSAKRRRVLKTTFVPETPHGKQGRKAVQRRQELLRKKCSVRITLPVVEETPEKKHFSQPTTSKSQTPVKHSGLEILSNAEMQYAQGSTTPKRTLRPKMLFSRVQATPPEWNSSECLFTSPIGDVEQVPNNEKTPKKIGSQLHTGNEQHCTVTPRRKVSKKLLSSPSTPKSTLNFPSNVDASPAVKRMLSKLPTTTVRRQTLFPKTETPRQLFSMKSHRSSLVKSVDSLDSLVADRASSGTQSFSTSSEQILGADNDAALIVTSEPPENSLSSPLLSECTSRFTRSKSRETGLSPHQLFVLSQKSPVRKGNHGFKKRGNKTVGCAMLKDNDQTPRHKVTKKVSYTPPSALSLLHLTSSPMLLKKTK